jgi:5-methyltetrahydropteroyltriglutamate--homocysteine methyltransferase
VRTFTEKLKIAARGVVDKVINPEFMLEVFNNTVNGLRAKTEVWCHTCCGNPSQQRMFAQVQSYKPALARCSSARTAAFAQAATDGCGDT